MGSVSRGLLSGAINGAAQGINQSANLWITDEMKKLEETRLREYQKELVGDKRAYDKAEKLEDREYTSELKAKESIVETKREEIDGKTYEVGYNANNEVVKRAEVVADPKTGRFVYKDGVVLDSVTGSTSGEPLNTKMSDLEKSERNMLAKLAGNENRSESEEKMFASLAAKYMQNSGDNKPPLADLIGQIKKDEAARDPSTLMIPETKRGLLSYERVERDRARENAPNPVRDAVRSAVDTVSDATTDDGGATVDYVKMRMQRKPSPADSRELEEMLLQIIEGKSQESKKQEARQLLKQLTVF